MMKLQVRLLLTIALLLAPYSFAADAELPIDLIEILGELDDEDNESLADAMLEIESKSSKQTPHTKEVKK